MGFDENVEFLRLAWANHFDIWPSVGCGLGDWLDNWNTSGSYIYQRDDT